MKQLLTLLALMLLSACYTPYPRYYDPNPPIQRPLQQDRWWWYQDPIYWGYPSPYFYRIPRRQVIVIPQPRVQEPRRNAFGPTAPPSAPRPRSSQAPIRTFPKPEDKK